MAEQRGEPDRGSDLHQIGSVAERVGLSLRTVRYYEEVGLIAPERRTDGGFRLYTEANVERLLLIKQMKPLGFSVNEMRDLLDARDIVREPDSGPDESKVALYALGQFAKLAEKRCVDLREQLTAAEQLAAQLAKETGGRVSGA